MPMSQTSIMHGIRAGLGIMYLQAYKGNDRAFPPHRIIQSHHDISTNTQADRDSKEICVANYDKEKCVNVQIVVRCRLVNADEKKLHPLVVIMCAENKREMCAVKTNYQPNQKHALNDEKPGVHLVSHSSVW
nr:kinesin-like protein KIN-5D [Tanacetum cinerariifolium]